MSSEHATKPFWVYFLAAKCSILDDPIRGTYLSPVLQLAAKAWLTAWRGACCFALHSAERWSQLVVDAMWQEAGGAVLALRRDDPALIWLALSAVREQLVH